MSGRRTRPSPSPAWPWRRPGPPGAWAWLRVAGRGPRSAQEGDPAARIEALLAALRPTLGAGVSDAAWAAAAAGVAEDVLGVAGELEAARAGAAAAADGGALREVAAAAAREAGLAGPATAAADRAAAAVAANPLWPAAAKASFVRGLARAMASAGGGAEGRV